MLFLPFCDDFLTGWSRSFRGETGFGGRKFGLCKAERKSGKGLPL
jgi:hypothetical protein